MHDDWTDEARLADEARMGESKKIFSAPPDYEMIQAFGQYWEVYSMTLQYDGKAAALKYLDFLLGRTWNPITGWRREYLVKFRDRLAEDVK